MIKTFNVSGVDLAQYVTNWADIEQIKDVLLAKATLMVGDLQLVCSNIDAQFSPEAQGSLFYGRNIFNQDCQIVTDGNILFTGKLKDIQCDHAARTATFLMQDILTMPADSVLAVQTLTGVNPAVAMLELIGSAGLTSLTDVQSFLDAAGPSNAAGATVTVTISNGNNDSLLNVLQQISELASISVFVQNGLIRAKAYVPYQGDGSNLKQLIDKSNVRDFMIRQNAYDSFNNSVSVYYDSSSVWTLTDPQSIALTGITRNFPFTTNTGAGNILAVPDLVSAQFYASTYLSRSSKPPVTIQLECGKEFLANEIGDRFPVSSDNWGYDHAPFELFETHHILEKNSVQLLLRGLF